MASTDSMTAMPLTTTLFCTASHSPVLQARGLTGGPAGLTLFEPISLSLQPGVSALLGDEGTGKTTLLRLLAGDLAATQGQLWVSGSPVPLSTPQPASVFWCDLRLPMHDADSPEACWAHLRRRLPAWSDDMQARLVADLQLSPHLGKRLNMLSTGSRRKVGLVAALASGATVTLLDQAFASLDAASVRVVEEVLRQASDHTTRACLIADYETPNNLPLASLMTLN